MTVIPLDTTIEGKKAYFGETRRLLKKYGYALCGNWEYDRGKFDTVLWREGGETIYLRIPFTVLEGNLDENRAYIEFNQPYLVKHVVNVGIDWNESALLTVAGFAQFQKPLDPDGHIDNRSRWKQIGEEHIGEVLNTIRVFE